MAGIADLVSAIVNNSGIDISKKDAEAVVKSVFETITSVTESGDSVTIRGFGSFKMKNRAARVCANPQRPGETVDVPAKVVLSFKASK